MPTFYVTPVVLSVLSVLILQIALLVYLLSIKNRSASTNWVTTTFFMTTLMMVFLLFRAALPQFDIRYMQFSYWSMICSVGALGAGLQHAYAHPQLLPGVRYETTA